MKELPVMELGWRNYRYFLKIKGKERLWELFIYTDSSYGGASRIELETRLETLISHGGSGNLR